MTTKASSTTTVASATLDLETPYYLHPFKSTSVKVVGDVLTGIDDCNPWGFAMIMALKGLNKFGFVMVVFQCQIELILIMLDGIMATILSCLGSYISSMFPCLYSSLRQRCCSCMS